MSEDWRNLNERDRAAIARRIGLRARLRYERGAEEHGSTFRDDPLEQLETELLDGLFYCEMAKREREMLRRG